MDIKLCDFKGIIKYQVLVDEGIEYVDVSLLEQAQEQPKQEIPVT